MMNHHSRRPKFTLLAAALLLLALTATGCVGTRLGVSWPGLSLIGEEQNILVTYNDRILLVDPISGDPVQLRDPNGELRFDPEGNPRLWDLHAGNEGLQGAQFFGKPLILDEDTLLVADHTNNKLVEIDLPTARVENPTGIPIEGKVLTDLISDGDTIFLPYDTENLQAFDPQAGAPAWTFETEQNYGVWAAPLLHEGVLYFTSMDQHLYAVNAETGEQLWKADLEGAAAMTPTLYNDRLYVGSFVGKVFVFSLEGEKLAEDYKTENWIWGAPVVQDDIVYVADLGNYVYALNANDLTEIWKQKVNGQRGIRPSPLVTEEYVIVASRDGSLEWLNRETGELIFEREVVDEILSDLLLVTPPPTDNEQNPTPMVIVSTISPNKLLVAFSLDGAERPLWSYPKG